MTRTPLALMLSGATSDLAAAGVESPRVDAELLAAAVLGVNRGRLALIDSMREEEAARFAELIGKRQRRIPLQHLLGTAAFRHVDLAVGEGVFIPRPETELLAGWGISLIEPGDVVVDLCSGSGAIAAAVRDESPAGRIIAVERSAAALEFLRRNFSGEVVEGDVTDPELLRDLDGQVDVVLCNPPYVPAATAVPQEVAIDPAEAVFGGDDGLAVIRPVVALAARLLRPGGVAGIEHDDTHAVAVPELFRADGRFDDVRDHADLAGRPRYATARRR